MEADRGHYNIEKSYNCFLHSELLEHLVPKHIQIFAYISTSDVPTTKPISFTSHRNTPIKQGL
jgi:hypothetical protein